MLPDDLPEYERSEFALRLFPGAKTRFDLSQAVYFTKLVSRDREDPRTVFGHLARFIFDHHPYVLDLPPAVSHRYHEARRVAEMFPQGTEGLYQRITAHFQEAEELFRQNQARAVAATPSKRLQGEFQIVNLPLQIAERGLVWNHHAQTMVYQDKTEELFGKEPGWTATKLADGAWLSAGNLMFEVVQGGIARAVSRYHEQHNLEDRWGFTLPGEMSDWRDLDQWVVMTHIVDKGLLGVARELGVQSHIDMIEGMKLTPAIYVRSYVDILQLMGLNPELGIRGILSEGTWIYDPTLKELFPQQSVAHLSEVAGDVVTLGTAKEMGLPLQAQFATHDSTRKKAFDEGKYPVQVVARFIDEQGMVAAIQSHGDDVAKSRLAELQVTNP